MNQELWTAVGAIGGLIGAVGGMFAAISAFRSAGTAKDSVTQMQAVERRTLMRNISTVANAAVAESMLVDNICSNLQREYSSMGVATGNTGSSRLKVLAESVEEKQQRIIPIQNKARELVENWKNYSNTSEQELIEVVTDIEGKLVQVERLKEGLQAELSSLEFKG